MSLAAHGAFRNLLDAAWENGGKIPNNEEVIWRYALAKSKSAFSKVAAEVLPMFTVSEDGKWLSNETLTDEWNDATDWFNKKSAAGKAGSTARWSHSSDMASPSQTDNDAIAPPMAKDSTSPHLTIHNQTVLKPSAQKRRGPKSPDQVTPFDSRHVRIKSLICNAYEQQNQAECPWDGGEGKQLKALLSATPGWVDSQIAQCLVNMYDSAGFAKGTRPREFLPRLPRYLNGPLNEFNREQSNVGTRSVSKADAREQRIVERAIAYRTVTAGASNSAGYGQMAVPGNGPTGVHGLDGKPEILPPGKDSGSFRPPDVRAAKT